MDGVQRFYLQIVACGIILSMTACLGGRAARPLRKLAIIAAAILLSTASFSAMVHFVHTARIALHREPQFQPCGSHEPLGTSAQTWHNARAKYEDLLEDKFTIALSASHHPGRLDGIMRVLLATKIPSLLEIVVIWSDYDRAPPQSFTSQHDVDVRYRMAAKKSMNEKLRPDPEYRTQAIFLSDDDVFYRPSDLELAFQSWKQSGQARLVGPVPRCASVSQDGKWEYGSCSRSPEGVHGEFTLMLTKWAFTHISFLDFYYFADVPTVARLRQHVDRVFDCEDIAFNFVVSALTHASPLLVKDSHSYHEVGIPHDASGGRGQRHAKAHHSCLNFFTEILGCMPLVKEEARIEL